MPGLDGQKMSKSYGNVIELREEPTRCGRAPHDADGSARIRRNDPGDPEKCPVWQFHLVYSDEETRAWAGEGCRTAAIGCLDCKQRVIDAVLAEQAPIRERAVEYESQPDLVRSIISDGCDQARDTARETMEAVREAMGLAYR